MDSRIIRWLALTVVLSQVASVATVASAPAAGVTEFERMFGEDVRRLRESGSPEDKGRLAEKVFLEARGRADDRAFVVRALDEVVRLASVSPAHQDLLYAALRTQKVSQLKQEAECMEAMMVAGPKALTAMGAPAAEVWLTETWLPDAMVWAERLCDVGQYAKAAAVLVAVRDAARAKRLAMPAGLDANIQSLERLQQAAGNGSGLYRAIAVLAQGKGPAAAAAVLKGDADADCLRQVLEMAASNKDRAEVVSALDAAMASLRLPSLAERLLVRSFAQAGTETLGRIVEETFFGVPVVGAGRIVFVIDFSGSMTRRLYYAKEELKGAIEALPASQRFQVIFFDTGANIMPPHTLVQATAANKAQADAFIDQMGSGGGTNPTDAIRAAFGLGADTIVLLTDGQFADSIIAVVDGLNATRRTRVHTIGFFSPGSQDVLRHIAARNGGTYKFVGDTVPSSP